MAEWGAAKWLLSLSLYFILYFLIVWSIGAMRTEVYATDPNFVYTSPDWYTWQETFAEYGGICSEPSNLYWHQIPFTDEKQLPCNQFDNEYLCNSFDNCDWQNISYLFIDVERCLGTVANTSYKNDYNVNMTFYNYSTPFDDFTTNATDLCSPNTNELTCHQFGCSWITNSQEYEKQLYDTNPYNFWNSIKFMFGFDVSTNQFGFYRFIWAIFFTYIPLIMLIVALRYTLPI